MESVPIKTELVALDIAARDPHDWKAFRDSLKARIVEVLEQRGAPGQPPLEPAALHNLRTIHDVLYVSDRLRKHAVRRGKRFPADLRLTAADVLAKANHRSVTIKGRRSADEERYVTAARVNWHKLLKRTKVVSAEQPDKTAPSLRQHASNTLEELLISLENSSATEFSSSERLHLAALLKECLQACRKV